MPVIFNTPSSHRIMMLDKDAAFMLKAMQSSGAIPGAMYPEAIPDALEALKSRVKLESESENTENLESGDYVSKQTRAYPLIELMESAIENDEMLLWDKG